MLSIMINHLNNYIIDNFLFIYKRLENHILIYLNRLLVLMEKLLDILVIQWHGILFSYIYNEFHNKFN